MKQQALFLLFCFPIFVFGQSIRGAVMDEAGNDLIGANVQWLDTSIGTSTDAMGMFEISMEAITDTRLVISYVGYASDTVLIEAQAVIVVQLRDQATLNQVEITARESGSYISTLNPVKTETLTQTELGKAACCDLAGCFETQASVKANTTNIVTNAKELRLLGLSGVYNQVLIDGLPLIQGNTYTYGVSTFPGTLVDKIHISKGANSVVQGFESIAGQINVELREPTDSDKLLLNAYMNSFLEKQFNINYTKKWENWSMLLAGHTTQAANKFDRDEDTFLDLPLLTRYTLYNKWQYGNAQDEGWNTRIGLRYVDEERVGGQWSFTSDSDKGTRNSYGQVVHFSQPEIYTKTGYRFNDKQQVTLLASAMRHEQDAYFGTTHYEATQQNAYANLQLEQAWKGHRLTTGLSYRANHTEEKIDFGQNLLERTYAGTQLKEENIAGVFAENVFNFDAQNLTLITGLRLDKHNTFGWFATPRALLKYDISDFTTARISAGKGWRTINLFSENVNLLASSRNVLIADNLQPEEAINYGINLTHKTYADAVETQFSIDFYRTEFQNQIFPDYDSDATKAYINNFTGESVSNSFQAEMKLLFMEQVETKLAYNYLDVYRIVNTDKQVLPFNSKHRVVGVLSYTHPSQDWHADLNVHWHGKQRLVNTANNPSEFQIADYSEPYYLSNIKLTKTWKRFELYTGCENIFNFRQERPILSWEQPFGRYFDTASVWGPTRGREFFLGVRFWVIQK